MTRRPDMMLGMVVGAAAWLLAGCLPPQADFSPGLSTSRISGFMNVPGGTQSDGGPLIIALKYHHTGISDPEHGTIYRPTAHVEYVAQSGAFSIDMPSDVVSMELLFIAPERLTEVFRFKRSLGMGNITYRANLRPMTDWRDHYFTFLSPQLQHLIVETRYQLSPRDSRNLSRWLEVQNARLEARRRGMAPQPEAAAPEGGSPAPEPESGEPGESPLLPAVPSADEPEAGTRLN